MSDAVMGVRDKPELELIVPTGRWRYFKRSVYRLLKPVTIAGVTIPAGFTTDGATLPPVVRICFDPMGIWAEAAFLHDYLLKCNPDKRCVASSKFNEAMRELGVPKTIRKSFYSAVRAYDWIKYLRGKTTCY